MTAPDYVAYDADGRILTELRCISCGHFLCGLLPDANCGECGSPVAWSLRGEVFLSADPEWLASVRSGTAELAMLLPWAWLPFTWPWIGWALWKASRPIPGQRAGQGLAHTPAIRVIMALFPLLMLVLLATVIALHNSPDRFAARLGNRAQDFVVPAIAAIGGAALFAAMVCLVFRRLGQGQSGRRFRTLTAWLFVLMTLSGLLLLGSAFARATDASDSDTVASMTALGATVAVVSLPWFVVALALAWRMIASSSAQAVGLRERPPYWQNAEPGRSAEADARLQNLRRA